MTRDEVEAAVIALYDSRLANDLEPCIARFCDDATFELAGSRDAGGFAQSVSGPDVSVAIETLIQNFKWISVDNRTIIIEGLSAAVRYHLTTTFTPTNETITTEIMDHVVLASDGRVQSITQFLDTAFLKSLTNA